MVGKAATGHDALMVCRRVTGREITAVPSQRRPGDGAISIADCTRATQVLGWKPQFGRLEDIISTAWAWQQRLYSSDFRAK